MLIDTHCHLDFEVFEQDRDQVVTYARERSLVRILNPGISYPTSLSAIRLSQKYPEVFAAIGIHPTEVRNSGPSAFGELAGLLPNSDVVAIGEIGLDEYWDQSSIGLQVDCLQQMLDLASRFNLPVVIHIRNRTKDDHKATEAAYNILAEWYKNLPPNSRLKLYPGVLHSFDDDYFWAEKFIYLHFMLGIGGRVTYRNANVLREVVAKAPLENLLTETDSPFVTPEPDRRKRNQPGNVTIVAEKIAQLRGLPYDLVASVTTSNARRLFAW